MKKGLALLITAFMTMSGTDCGSSAAQTQPPNENKTEQSENTADSDTSVENADADENKIAVVYFSATGTTENIAKELADVLKADTFEIVPAEEYTSDDLNYNDDNCRANKEMNDSSARPEISNDLSNITDYDTIFVGYPIWWGTSPRIINTFFDTYNLSGKTIYTFCTSGSSGIDKSISDLNSAYPDLNIADGRRFGANAGESDISDWTDSLFN